MLLAQLRPAIVLTLAFTLLTGIAYPLAITGIGQALAPAQASGSRSDNSAIALDPAAAGQALAPAQASGSRIERDGTVVGSALIGQSFTAPDYFWPRPSATGPDPYNAAASSGSNYGPTDARLVERVASARATDPSAPADALTTSASGLDPHISPANARAQMPRVAEARDLEPAELEALVTRMTEQPVLGIFGEPVVNVLRLNLALDELAPRAR